MLNIGMSELLLFGIIALLVLGPEKLPEAARFVGKWYGKLKRMVSNVQNDIDRELRMSELREQMQQEMQRIQALELKMQQQMQELQQQSINVEASPSTQNIQNKNSALAYYYLAQPVPSVYWPQHWHHRYPLSLQNGMMVTAFTCTFSELKVAV